MGTTVDLGNVIGPQGPQGVQGIQGPKGDTGPVGDGWYVLELQCANDNNSVEIDSNTVTQVFNAYPYVVCTLNYGGITSVFVPTARYKQRDVAPASLDSDSDTAMLSDTDESAKSGYVKEDGYIQSIQFACLTLDKTASDAGRSIKPYYNCIVVYDSGYANFKVKDVDPKPTATWGDVTQKPFGGVNTSKLSSLSISGDELNGWCGVSAIYAKDNDQTWQLCPELNSNEVDGLVNAWPYCFLMVPSSDKPISAASNRTMDIAFPYCMTPNTWSISDLYSGAYFEVGDRTSLVFKSSTAWDKGRYGLYFVNLTDATITYSTTDSIETDWSAVQNKPFASLSDKDFTVDSNTLKLAKTYTWDKGITGKAVVANGQGVITLSADVDDYTIKVDANNKLGCNINNTIPVMVDTGPELSPAITSNTDNLLQSSVIIGNRAVGGIKSVVIGTQSGLYNVTDNLTPNSGGKSVSIGFASNCVGVGSVSIGFNTYAHKSGSIAIGHQATATETDSICIGQGTRCTAANSVCLGDESVVDTDYCLSIGNNTQTRRIVYVADPVDNRDAATKGYVDWNVNYIKLGTLDLSSTSSADAKFIGLPNIEDLPYEFIDKLESNYVIQSLTFVVNARKDINQYVAQTFTVSQEQTAVVSGAVNADILADCFPNYGMVVNSSTTMLNLARIQLSVQGDTALLNVSAVENIKVQKKYKWDVFAQLAPAAMGK